MPTTRPFCRVLGAALLGWLAPSSPALAQSMLGGVVRDPSGQVASDAQVVARDVVTGQAWEARSNAIGLVAFYHLPPGRCTITATKPPYAPFVEVVEVRPRQKKALDIRLRVDSATSYTYNLRVISRSQRHAEKADDHGRRAGL